MPNIRESHEACTPGTIYHFHAARTETHFEGRLERRTGPALSAGAPLMTSVVQISGISLFQPSPPLICSPLLEQNTVTSRPLLMISRIFSSN